MPKYYYKTIPAVPAKRVQVWHYEDLPEESKKKIRKHYDQGMDDFAYDMLKDDIEYQLKEAGLPSGDVSVYSNYNWSVGFFGSLYGDDIIKACKAIKFKLPTHDIDGNMFTDSLCVSFHNTSSRDITLGIEVDYPSDWEDEDSGAVHFLWEPLVEKLKAAMEKMWHDKCDEFVKMCNAEEEYRSSEQYVIDQTEGNTYTKEGEEL